jgi:hypothetical protein
VPLVVEMFAKETMGVSADKVRAGLLRLDICAKLSTQGGAPSMFDTFFEAKPLLVDQRSVPCGVGFDIAHIFKIGGNWSRGHSLIGHQRMCRKLCKPKLQPPVSHLGDYFVPVGHTEAERKTCAPRRLLASRLGRG